MRCTEFTPFANGSSHCQRCTSPKPVLKKAVPKKAVPKSIPVPAPAPVPPPAPLPAPAAIQFTDLSVEQVKRFTVTFFHSERDAHAEKLGEAIESQGLNGFTIAKSTVDDLEASMLAVSAMGFRATSLHEHMQQAMKFGVTEPGMALASTATQVVTD